MPKIMIMAGEASGDMHGAKLAEEIKRQDPTTELIGAGSSMMANAGVRLVVDMAKYSTVGVLEALKNLRMLKRLLQVLEQFIEQEQPDVVVLIDYPGFHLEVAKILKAKQIRSVYYFCPSAWAWGKGRAKKVAERMTKVASVFPFEEKVYREAGADVEFVGHPLLDIIAVGQTKEEFFAKHDLEADKPLIGLLPGSREQEIETLLPLLLESAKKIQQHFPDCQFVLPLSHTISREQIQAAEKDVDVAIKIITGQSYEVMAYSELILVSSGTATLEAACLGVPMVIVYKVTGVTWFLGKLFVKIPYIGLPNIIAEKQVVPEFLQDEANVENVSKAALALLLQPEKRQEMKADLQKVREKLGDRGAVERVASLVLRLGRME